MLGWPCIIQDLISGVTFDPFNYLSSMLVTNYIYCCTKLMLNFSLDIHLRWFETVFHFSFQLNFMKDSLVCSKKLLLLVDSWCYNNLSTYQLSYSHWHFGCHGNLKDLQIHPISIIQLHCTQVVFGKLPFL